MEIDAQDKFHELLGDFDSAMLVTRCDDGGLRARPMAVAKVTANGNLWFITQRESGKVDEIESDPHVNVTMQSGRKFVSLSGQAAIVDDRQKVNELWNEAWRVWFPDGKNDASLVLLHVDAAEGEYWDNSGEHGLKYLFEAGKAYLSGRRPADIDQGIHAKVKL